MKRSFMVAVCATFCILSVSDATASLVYNAPNAVLSQNFNSLASTGSNNSWTNNSTVNGWYLFNGAGSAITTYSAGVGSSTTGSFYSFGTVDSDRALGGVGSGGTYFGSPATGAVAGYIAVGITNQSNITLNKFNVEFDGEQWRNGGNTSAQSMVMQYGFGASFAAVTTWNAPGGNFNWSSPVATSTAAAVDGNVAGLVDGRGGEVTGLNWTNGSTLWIRWVELNDAGNDHGLAIDNFSFSAVPEPSAFLLVGSVLGLAAVRRRRA
jgi:hypothetical protein